MFKSLLCSIALVMVTCTAVLAQSGGLSFFLSVGIGHDFSKLNESFIADPNMTFVVNPQEQSRVFVGAPRRMGVGLEWAFNQNLGVQSGLFWTTRKLSYRSAYARTSGCIDCPIDIRFADFSVPVNLLVTLNPGRAKNDWKIVFAPGFSINTPGKLEKDISFTEPASETTPSRTDVREVSENTNKMFFWHVDEPSISFNAGLSFERDFGNKGGLRLGFDFQKQVIGDYGTLQIWEYFKEEDRRGSGYNPVPLKFTSMLFKADYIFPRL